MFKAFVSSTYDDLIEHRGEAIRALQAAGITVDPMETWQADRASPSVFSAARLQDCDLCVLLVGFRRGTIPAGQGRSIVQQEYDEARKRGIDVLPFLLREDAPLGDGRWPEAFDDRRSEPGVDAWRRELRQTHGLGEFGVAPSSVRIEPALARWVVQRSSDRNRRVRRAVTTAVALLSIVVLAALAWSWHVLASPQLLADYHSRFLAFSDPVAFNRTPSGLYDVARVLADHKAMTGGTNFTQELADTRETFDMLANNAQYVRHSYFEVVKKLLARGVKIRMVLWDYTAPGDAYAAFHKAVGASVTETRSGASQMRRWLIDTREEIRNNPERYPGSLEVRWNPRPLLYTMWVRDWGKPGALGHLSPHFYRGQQYWPAFRVTSTNGPDMLENLHLEFEDAWAGSTPDVQRPALADIE